MIHDAERDARNQALFRDVNEHISELAMRLDVGGYDSYICECGDTGCTQPMAMTRDEYDAVRNHAKRFAVLPGHENPAVEEVVERRDRFIVVEAFAG